MIPISSLRTTTIKLSAVIRKIQPRSIFTPVTSSVAIKNRFISTTGNLYYENNFQKSLNSPEEFWDEIAQDITWFKKYDQVLDHSNPPFTKWFVGGQMNNCYEAFDVHVLNGHGDDVAMIYDSPVTSSTAHLTYRYLQNEAAKFARVLVDNGVKKGDRVIIYMPMIPEAIIAIYGCARIGAIHCVVFGGFASNELARRIDDAKPTALVTASCGIEPNKVIRYEPLVDKALQMASHQPKKVITVDREQYRKEKSDKELDLLWHDVMDIAAPHDVVPIDANDPLYILYTSGTTGRPKGVVRPNGGHAVALKWSMKNLYNIHPGDVWWAASDIGWIVGHSYIVYAPFFNRSTSVLFEGKPIGCPDASTFFRVIDQHDVAGLFTAPTVLRVIRNEDPDGEHAKKFEMNKFRNMFLAGENADIDLLEWSKDVFRTPIIDNWWQTESGWPITCHHLGLGMRSDYPFGSIGKPTPGWNVKVLDKDFEECQPGELGQIYVKLPLPPAAMSTLWNNDEGFVDAYFKTLEGYYDSCDAGTIDENGYVSVGGRIDDIINVAGHRLSTKQIEMAIGHHNDVMEQAVIGVKDEVKGLNPVGLIVLRKGVKHDEETIKQDIVNLVRHDVGPVASFKKVIILPSLPKTRAGKFVRGAMKKILDGDEYTVPQTVENPDEFEVIADILKKSQ